MQRFLRKASGSPARVSQASPEKLPRPMSRGFLCCFDMKHKAEGRCRSSNSKRGQFMPSSLVCYPSYALSPSFNRSDWHLKTLPEQRQDYRSRCCCLCPLAQSVMEANADDGSIYCGIISTQPAKSRRRFSIRSLLRATISSTVQPYLRAMVVSPAG